MRYTGIDHDPFGMLLVDRTWQLTTTYKYGFNGKENVDDVYGNDVAVDFGARIYDGRLGRWFGIDNLTKKYPGLSPFIFTANSPILFTDFDGNDWFINQTTGEIIFIKNESALTKEIADKFHLDNINPNDFEKLGPDDMFGKKVSYGGFDLLKEDYFTFDLDLNSDAKFFEEYGYYYAEKVIIKEKQYISSGPMDGGERVTTSVGTIEQIGGAKKTIVKKEELNKKEVIEKSNTSGDYSQISTTKYRLTKPAGQKNNVTAIYRENRITRDQSIALNIRLLDLVVDILFAPKKN